MAPVILLKMIKSLMNEGDRCTSLTYAIHDRLSFLEDLVDPKIQYDFIVEPFSSSIDLIKID